MSPKGFLASTSKRIHIFKNCVHDLELGFVSLVCFDPHTIIMKQLTKHERRYMAPLKTQ